MSCLLIKHVMPWSMIFLHLAAIFAFSAASISATWSMDDTLTRDPYSFTLSVSMGVLAIRMVAFSMRLGWPTPTVLASRMPSSRKESLSLPPAFLMIWMWSRSSESFTRKMASTASLAKWSFSCVTNLELSVVRAILNRSSRKRASSVEWSTALASRAARATSTAVRQPAATVIGWMRMAASFSASRSSSPQSTVTEVVPSPTSESCVRAMSMSTLAAALSTTMDCRMVAPSFVTVTPCPADVVLCRILSMPLGPSVVLTKSAMAMAPTNDAMRAPSPLSTDASSARIGWGP
mmetsp:Transcript_49243/g.118341  ORF Transcript_49243/g.118341 Transcript_49243/m.118341 type:complete len:292 (+) Transcript_49243:748-1623(+)